MYGVPRIVYDAGAGAVTLNFTYPSKPHGYESMGIGGQDVSASGVPEAYEIRRDHLLTWTLVFLESEWIAVETWLRLAQRQQFSFTFRPDKDVATEFTVYLESPKMGETIKPVRASQYQKAFTLDLVFRRTSGGPFDIQML